MPNNSYQLTNAKYQMPNNREIHDIPDEKTPKHENNKEQSESVTVFEPYIDTCIIKPELQNRVLL